MTAYRFGRVKVTNEAAYGEYAKRAGAGFGKALRPFPGAWQQSRDA